ncbi:ABC transporter permease [Alteromonas sp. a30]|uniref:ABC transporter permease n=1 Tax=Alteromonas sp. a30 TaxID=2730917 RepID=UPI00227F6259|nr:DUF3526 domain-containing protein [Alteromonas sp. a30]MCY7295601.1 DUF3526 domain-containing protein [Alteromonas sp. a30]
MIATLLCIARDEWRYWRRSRLALSLLIIALILAIASVFVTHTSMQLEAEQRTHLQTLAQQKFADQPDRHPHRMVHYGHYVFRAPPPLSSLDPGIDPFTGTSVFLEGHRRNGATFSEQQQSSGLSWLGTLSPAFVMQLLTPLLLIVMGYGAMTREREAGTFDFLKVQGITPPYLIAGKGLALISAGLLVFSPFAIGAIWALINGAEGSATAMFLVSYVLYILIWSSLILLASTLSANNAASFSSLTCLWIVLCLVLPRIASNTATVVVASPGKLETDFAVLQELRKLGDGHNSNDPAFSALKSSLLAKYEVDKIEDLPVNFKGIVAQKSEAKLTKILNQFSEKQMQEAQDQANVARQFGWLSPAIAIQNASMKLAGTDLENYHRFLREAEAVRFSFVQSLNKLHAENVSYTDDANKYKDHETHHRAKVDAKNWQILDNFHFTPLAADQRISNSQLPLTQLLMLFLLCCGVTFFAGKRV